MNGCDTWKKKRKKNRGKGKKKINKKWQVQKRPVITDNGSWPGDKGKHNQIMVMADDLYEILLKGIFKTR